MAVLARPTLGALAGDALLTLLTGFYEAIVALKRTPVPSMIALATRAALRKTPGTSAGPLVCILAGTSRPLDGGEAAYVWDATSTAADDGATVISPGAKAGRWRKASL